MTWSPELYLKSIEDISDQLKAPVLEGSQRLTMTNDTVSHDVGACDEYLNAVAAGFYADASDYKRLSDHFVYKCFVLRDLQHARAATSGSSYHWSANSLNELPPMLIVGAREIQNDAEQAKKRGESWKQFDPTLAIDRIQGDWLYAEDEDEAYSIRILARADFNGDGADDVAVFGAVTGKHSTYKDAVYMILSPLGNGKLVPLTSDIPPYRMKVQLPK